MHTQTSFNIFETHGQVPAMHSPKVPSAPKTESQDAFANQRLQHQLDQQLALNTFGSFHASPVRYVDLTTGTGKKPNGSHTNRARHDVNQNQLGKVDRH